MKRRGSPQKSDRNLMNPTLMQRQKNHLHALDNVVKKVKLECHAGLW